MATRKQQGDRSMNLYLKKRTKIYIESMTYELFPEIYVKETLLDEMRPS